MDTGKLSNDSDSLDIIKDNVSVTLDGMWFATGPVGPSWVTRGGTKKSAAQREAAPLKFKKDELSGRRF